ncbi:cellulose biosynthesis cyclic di-GMP-binding regulatory protein BcsB [Klebsiella pneumoniae]|uniref:cellulose biosynthesis cyclic di-GMP-binding regulatory protein BcsB n=1 Tax=Klebsiella pneumoniae TaxID=573 RepID=UPI00217FB86D|nr:cellulose biosynthesis cyclic di-GMP-binding regulatory protein BcsB [Klebsiella pneumoniae]MCS7326058.1 cellulose biosynthesis cyclic di-GMP-binding regulatory protein BcsB [Klebsiella pneumoniae]MCS7339397.1 cellulose biosynthesis cyclic di-GMP-binding regulatory protein BcsB [Klebsiella pneumoniae]
MKRKLSWMCAVAVGMCSWYPLASYAAPAAVANAAPGVQPQAATPAAPIVVGEPTATLAEPTAPAAVAENVPQREVKLSFATIAPPPGSIVLRGSRPDASVEFGMRSDELVANALLNLEYTPSPSLLPVQSQLKVYLNDELMGVLPVTKEQLGKKIRAQLPIDPLYITDFNRVRLEFVGHYRDVCENPASSTLWLDVGRESYLDLTYQSLKVNNDLSHFPVPFYDPRDNRPLKLPMIFPGSPAVTQQQAAAIVASWFGSKAGWRGQQFPVYFNELPDRNAIVFATNDKRPDFLRDHPPVKAPTIEMIDNPNDPYVKLLVIFGRDDNDLLLAAKGIAQGNILFRGSSVTVDGIKTLQPRQPYDAPNWVRTDRSVTFAELKTYEQQLQSSGLVPDAITVALNLPPDLYLNGDAQVLEGQNARLLLKRGQQEYAFPVRVARVNGSEVGLQLLPLTNQQHIDFVQCTFARADTWALWQDSFPEDKPMESLLDILKLGFRGYRHLAEFSPPSVKVVFRALTSLVAWIASFVPRRPERAAPTLSADPAMAQQ